MDEQVKYISPLLARTISLSIALQGMTERANLFGLPLVVYTPEELQTFDSHALEKECAYLMFMCCILRPTSVS